MAFDLVIRNGTIVDGSGMPRFMADVAIAGDRIAHIGRIDAKGHREIDADGHVISPGFIDGHTHMDAQVFWDPLGTCSCWHGVTTVVMGNCGFTLAPVQRGAEHLVVSNLEKAEDIPAAAMAAGIDWSWESFPEYLDAVDGTPKAINYLCQVGHSALRTFVMGDRAFEHGSSEEDRTAMQQLLREALVAGAAGFSTSVSDHHSTLDGRPVASRLADWSEIQALVQTMGEVGSGIFQLATETQSTESDDPHGARLAYEQLQSLAVGSRVPITFGMRRQHVQTQLQLFDETAGLGGRIFGQTRSEPFSQVMSFKTSLPYDELPVWHELRSRPYPDQLARLQDPNLRRALVAAVDASEAGGGATFDPRVPKAKMPPFDLLEVMRYSDRPNPTVAGLAAERRIHPVELMIDLSVQSSFAQVFGRYTGWLDDDLLTTMRHPRTVMTFSDQGAHVSYILGSSIQSRLLSDWVRERGLFSLEEAIRMLTLVPAMAWGVRDRGLVREGMVADLNIFDPAVIAPGVPTIETDLPAQAPRVKQKATGILSTIVGGAETFSRGEHTGELPGRLVRLTAMPG